MNEFLEQLAERLQIPDAEIITADEVAAWPNGKFDELVGAGILTEIEHSTGVVCDQCEENCYIEPDIRENPVTGRNIGVFVCSRRDDIGRITVDLNRLRQWLINKKKLSQLGYGLKTKERGKGQTQKQKRQGEVLQIQAALLKHHRYGQETINYEPTTQKQLQGLLGWKQSKVHRVMKAIFGDNPMTAYRQRCKTKTIAGFLKKSDNGRYSIEAVQDSAEQ